MINKQKITQHINFKIKLQKLKISHKKSQKKSQKKPNKYANKIAKKCQEMQNNITKAKQFDSPNKKNG